MPQIDASGSTSVVGGIDIHYNGQFVNYPFTAEKSLRLKTTIYIIHSVNSNIQKLEGGFEIEGGLYQQEIEVKRQEYNEKKREIEDKIVKISLLGTQATLELVKKDRILTVPRKDM